MKGPGWIGWKPLRYSGHSGHSGHSGPPPHNPSYCTVLYSTRIVGWLVGSHSSQRCTSFSSLWIVKSRGPGPGLRHLIWQPISSCTGTTGGKHPDTSTKDTVVHAGQCAGADGIIRCNAHPSSAGRGHGRDGESTTS